MKQGAQWLAKGVLIARFKASFKKLFSALLHICFANGQKCFCPEVQNAGIAFQLRPNRPLQLKPLNATFSLGLSMYKSFNRFLSVYYILDIN